MVRRQHSSSEAGCFECHVVTWPNKKQNYFHLSTDEQVILCIDQYQFVKHTFYSISKKRQIQAFKYLLSV